MTPVRPSFLPVAPALKPVVQSATFDGRRMGFQVPFDARISSRLREMGATWFAPRRSWVFEAEALRDVVPEMAALDFEGYSAAAVRELSAGAWSAPQRGYFAELLDVQVLALASGGFAVSSLQDPLVRRAMRSLQGRYHRHARAWEVRATRADLMGALAAIAGVDEVFVFEHVGHGVLEDLSSSTASQVPISVPGATPSRFAGAKSAGEGDEGSAFISLLAAPLRRVPVDERRLAAEAATCGLRDYQVDGVRHLLSLSSALLADDMGLGKTRQAVVAGRLAAGQDAVLVACPASLALNWVREIQAAYPDARVALVGQHAPDKVAQAQWIVANYERLGAVVKAPSIRIGAMLVDEAHYLKEHQAGRTRNAFLLAERVPRRFLLTGTPVLSREVEVHTLLRLSGHPLGAMPLADFRREFAGDAAKRELLAARVKEWMLRRGKDVLKDLGDKYHQVRYVQAADGLASYQAILKDPTLQAMPKITALRQHLEALKVDFLIESIQALPADAKAIVFCEYTDTLQQLKQALEGAGTRCVTLTGSDSTTKRMAAVDAFQKDAGVKVFVGTTSAAGVGITLTAANYVFFASLPWTPALKRQAEDRAYRSGQTRDVFVIIPLVEGTIDDRIFQLLDAKRDIEVSVIEANRAHVH